MNKITLGIGAIIIVIILSAISAYNSLISQDESVKKEWGNLESTLQRRLDLIPNLVQTVKGYTSHESETLLKVVDARANATSIKIDPSMINSEEGMKQFQRVQNQLSVSLSRLLAVAESYPDLKASDNFRDLTSQLEGTENRISVARQNYNNQVRSYNYSIRQFPNSLVNRLFLNLPLRSTFSADADAKTAPKIDFRS